MILYTSSCIKSPDDIADEGMSVLGMKVSPDFKFSTTSDLNIKISTLDNQGNPVSNIRLNVYTDLPTRGGALIISGATDESGALIRDIKLPVGTDSLAVGTDAIGFVNMQKVKVGSSGVDFVLGGKQPNNITKRSASFSFRAANTLFKFLGTFNTLGVPDYLETVNDVIDSPMLNDINATLPESQPLTESHPQYLTSTNETNLVLTDECNVWVTFVHEGAGYKNVMGYYTYNVSNPPKTASEIETLNIVFPNVSYANSGGGLKSGNKVYIGRYAPGTVIGWVLISNGFKGTSDPSGIQTIYSNDSFNSETTAARRKHVILLNDIGRSKFLLSFEDFNRDAGSDNDFNDAIFYVTADPVSAVDASNIPLPNYTAPDSDKDGVSDNFDDYPDDPTKAFNNYYPSQGNVATLAFEDQWPIEGDYDFNDLVVDYNFNQITNSKNQVVQIKAGLTIIASGAHSRNGFGIQFPVAAGDVAAVSGTNTGTGIKKNSNGTESGQSKAVVVVFDDQFNILPRGGSGVGANTTPGDKYVQPKTLNLIVDLTSPLSLSDIGTPPYNPFIFSNGRTSEVHLIDNLPTDLANMKLFGVSDDNSNPSSGRYYVTKYNLPFAIDITARFDYPIEGKKITDAYYKFIEWGMSGGGQFYDWFKSTAGYRNNSNIYSY